MVNKIKVLYVADTFLPKKDGVIRFILESSKRLGRDFEVSFLVPKLDGSEVAARTLNAKTYFVPVRRFKIADYPPPKPVSKVVNEAIDNADIVFVNSIAPLGASAIKYARSKQKKIIAFAHAIEWELLAYATRFPDKAAGILKPIIRRIYNKCNLILVADNRIASMLRRAKITVPLVKVPLGVDQTKFFPDRIKRVYMRRKLNLTNRFVIGFHGRLSREKNIELLINSFKLVRKQIPDARLLILGDGPEISKIPANADIITTGFVSNPEDYLQAMDVYVLPSSTETTGLSAMEAMSCGLVTIAPNIGAIPSYLNDNVNGVLIDKKSMTADLLANTIKWIYKSPRTALHLRGEASKAIRNFYTWEATTRELEKVFKRVIK